MKTKLLSLICVLGLFLSLNLASASALTITGLYGDTVGSNSVVTNLSSVASNYDSFSNSSYICFRDSQNSYYLAWGDNDDFTITDNTIIGSSIEYVRYYRQSNSSTWEYAYAEGDSLSVYCDYLVTTNISGVKGSISYEIDDWNFRRNTGDLILYTGILIFVVGLLVSVRRC